MSENKIISQETKAVIDTALAEAKNYRDMAYEKVQVAETKAAEARASYEAILAEETTLVNTLLTKTSLTEEEFLKIVNAGKQSSLKLNTRVTLSNSNGKSNLWLVAGINHDGTTDTVDLIAKNMIQNNLTDASIGKLESRQPYKETVIYSWLNNTYITGFSTNIKNCLKFMEVDTDIDGTIVTTQDKIKLLSMNELGFDTATATNMPTTLEGTMYPIFESGNDDSANTKRIKCKWDGVTPHKYYVRTRINHPTSGSIRYIDSDGSYNSTDQSWGFYNHGIVPVIRF